MKLDKKSLLRVGIFGVLTVAVLLCLNSFFQPVWTKWNNFYTTKGFYKEPKNTIETVFLGASVMQSSVSPMEMYEEYGINAYNLGTEQQPVLGSYYWLRETYDYHSETLKNVVLDASSLRSTSKESFYHKCFDNMRLSKNKIQAAYEYKNGNIMSTVSFLTPLISYHSRWSSLDATDFQKYTWDPDTGTRGYYYIKNTYVGKMGYDNVPLVSPILDTKAESTTPLLAESLEYLDKIINFCEEKGLNFVLIRTSASNWDSGLHNAVQDVADSYGIKFYDFNYAPLADEVEGYLHGFDNSSDGHHLNYYGATKFTKWMGKFLVEEFGATDVRDNPKYDFMKKQYEEYKNRVLHHVDLNSSKYLTEYIGHAMSANNTLLISVEEEAATALTKAERDFFREKGLEKLADIGRHDAYLGVVENGKVIYEKLAVSGSTDKPISYRGMLPDGKTSYSLKSGGKNNGKTASILIGGESQIDCDRGINMVVYNNDLEETLHNSNFDTYKTVKKERYGITDAFLTLDEDALNKSYSPTSIEGRILTYYKKVQELREYETLKVKLGSNSLFNHFDEYFKEGIAVLLSVYDTAPKTFTDKDRANFKKYGLEKLSELNKPDSYVAYIKDGKVVKEVSSTEGKVIYDEADGIYLNSGSYAFGKASSIKINGVEYSLKTRGINMVVYNTETGEVLARDVFDTHKKPITY